VARASLRTLIEKIRSEADAYELLEEMRWAGRPVCPHCGSGRRHYFLTPRADAGRQTRRGRVSERRVWKCAACRRQFSVLTGTIMHGSKIPASTWLLVIADLCDSRKGLSARDVRRKYGLSGNTAWHMLHRLGEAMQRDEGFRALGEQPHSVTFTLDAGDGRG
jgi:transposase-like protein